MAAFDNLSNPSEYLAYWVNCFQTGFSQLFVYMGKYAYLDNDYRTMLDYWGVVLF